MVAATNPYKPFAANREGEVASILQRLDFNRHMNLIVFGAEHGMLLEACLERMSQHSRLILIQITDADRRFVIEGDWTLANSLADERVLLLGGTPEEIMQAIPEAIKGTNVINNIRNINLITLPCQKSLFQKDITHITKHLLDGLTALAVSFGNSTEDVLIGTDNFFNNWSLYLGGISVTPFKDSYIGQTAVVVGAGPSLDYNLDVLRKLQGKVLILAVDAALKTLLANGIVPDMVSTLERLDVTKKFYNGISIPDQVVFGGPSIISGDVIGAFKRKVFTGRNGDGFLTDFEEISHHKNLDIGMNVSHVPFAFALYAGCSTIVLVGMDLAYTDGKTHSAGVSGFLDKTTRSVYENNVKTVMGQGGNLLQTYEYFLYSKVWLEATIINNPQVTVLNASKGGAKILGTKDIDLAAYVLDPSTDQAIQRLWLLYDHCQSKFNSNPEYLSKSVEGYLSSTLAALRGFLGIIRESLEELQGFAGVPMNWITENWESHLAFFRHHTFLGALFQPLYVAYNYQLFAVPVIPTEGEIRQFAEVTAEYYRTLILVGEKIVETVEIYRGILRSINAGGLQKDSL